MEQEPKLTDDFPFLLYNAGGIRHARFLGAAEPSTY
jgi:hypothetical protein